MTTVAAHDGSNRIDPTVRQSPQRASARSAQQLLLVAATAILGVTFLWPLLRVPFISDDAVLAHLPESKDSLGAQLTDVVLHFANTGRLTPLSYLQSTIVFNLVKSEALYHALQIALIVLNLFLLHRVMQRLLGSASHGYLAVLVVLGTLQTRRYHDAVLSFHGLITTTMALLLGAVLVMIRYSEGWRHERHARSSARGRNRANVTNVTNVTNRGNGGDTGDAVAAPTSWRPVLLFGVLWTASLLYYEICFTLVPLWLILAWRMRAPMRRRFITTTLIPTVTIGALTVFARMVATAHYEGSEANLDPVAVAKTWLLQLSATVPFGYRARNSPLVSFTGPSFDLRIAIVVLATAVLAGFVARTSLATARHRVFPTLLIGAALVFGPSAMISTSKQYQDSISPFIGYIPVYMQYFGATMIAVGLAAWVAGMLEAREGGGSVLRIAQPIVVVLVALTVPVSADSFRQVAVSLRPTATDRELVRSAAKYGFWTSMPSGSRVWMGPQTWAWTTQSLNNAGLPNVKLVVENTIECVDDPTSSACRLKANDIVLMALADRHDNGLLISGTVASVQRTDAGPVPVLGRSTVLVRGEQLVAMVRDAKPVLFGKDGTPVPIATAKILNSSTATFTFDGSFSTADLHRPGFEQHSPYV